MKNKVFINDDTPVEVRIMNHIAEVKETKLTLVPPSQLIEINKNECFDVNTGLVRKIKKDAFYNRMDEQLLDYYGFYPDFYFEDCLKDSSKDKKNDSKNKDKTNTSKKSKPKSLKGKTRLDNPKSLSVSRRLNKNIIINNFQSKETTQFITLLYDDFQNDYDRAGKDMDNLLLKLERRYRTDDNDFKYFYGIEYDSKGSIHFHLLLYWDKYIPVEMTNQLDTIWKKGIMYYDTLKEDKDILFVAAYMTYGLSGNDNENVDKYSIANTNEEKKNIKHQRMSYFKANQKNFRHSNGMKEGKKIVMPFKEFREKFGVNKSFYDGYFKKDVSTFLTIEQFFKYYEI